VVEAKLLGSIAQTRLRHRLFMAEGKMGYLFEGDRVAVELDKLYWPKVAAEYDDAVVRATKRLKLAFTLTIPVVIATLVVVVNVPLLDDLTKRLDRIPGVGAAMGLAMVTWLPLTGLFVHARAVSQARKNLESRLAHLPKMAPPAKRPRLHQNLQIVVMLLAGPALLIRTLGSLFPGLYRNTPLSGMQLGWIDLFAVLAVTGWLATRPRDNDR
jgi:hypothetical protein